MTGAALERIRGSDRIDDVIAATAAAFDLGGVQQVTVIATGYEDCNVIATTERGRFLVKIFAARRSPSEIDRYVEIIEHVCRAGVAHPALRPRADGPLLLEPVTGNRIVVLDFVEGSTYLDLGRTPTDDELAAVAEQAAKIHSLALRPEPIYDSWAVPNIADTYQRVIEHLDPDDAVLANQAFAIVQDIPRDALPHALVHGDLTKANVVLTPSGSPVVIDLAAANVYPRVQELAVMAANLLHDGETPLRERVGRVVAAYEQSSPLTAVEHEAVQAYALGAASMEMLASFELIHLRGDDSDETRYWLELGRSSLREAIRVT